MESIGGWIRAVFAGHVLAEVEEALVTVQQVDVHTEHLAEMQASLASLPKDIRSLKPGKYVRYNLWFGVGKGVYGIRRRELRSWQSDQEGTPTYEVGRGKTKLDFDYSVYDEAEVLRVAQDALQAAINHTKRSQALQSTDKMPVSQARLVNLVLLKRECLKYTSSPKLYKSKTAKKFPLDLTGWKYLRPNAPIIEKTNTIIEEKNKALRKKIEEMRSWGDENLQFQLPYTYEIVKLKDAEKYIKPLLGPDDVMDALKERGWTEITVILDFAGHAKSRGTWKEYGRELTVDVRGMTMTVDGFHDAFNDTVRTLRHELQHVGQDVLQHILSLTKEVGTPAENIQVPFKPTKKKPRKEHALREEEFYTRLSDEVDNFVDYAKRQPKMDLRKLFQNWITRDSEFFSKLHEHESLKWGKAVKEFTKAIEAKGITV